MYDFSEKTVAITGGGSGIGAATATLLFEYGASVALCGRDHHKLDRTVKDLENIRQSQHQRVKAYVVDIADGEAVLNWVDEVLKDFGSLDHAANIAGSGAEEHNGSIPDKTDTDFDAMININLRGVFNCLRAQLPQMRKGSSIVNCSSGAAKKPIPGMSLYSAAKAGMENLSMSAAREFGPSGIRVNVLTPGFTLSPPLLALPEEFLAPKLEEIPLRHAAEPRDIAGSIVYLLSDHARYQTGSVMMVDGGHLC